MEIGNKDLERILWTLHWHFSKMHCLTCHLSSYTILPVSPNLTVNFPWNLDTIFLTSCAWISTVEIVIKYLERIRWTLHCSFSNIYCLTCLLSSSTIFPFSQHLTVKMPWNFATSFMTYGSWFWTVEILIGYSELILSILHFHLKL